MANNNSWIPKKYGIINLWKYAHQEFIPNGGNLYFLGINGSGKTTTAMLFMPMLLNGVDTRYLSPDGSRKSVADIALGAKNITGDDYRIGYIYGEFINEQTAEVVTLGIGIEATRDTNEYKSWYFILKNKYRIGENISLYTENKTNKEFSPYTKKELKKKINGLNNKEQAMFFTDKQAYKEQVRKLLFQNLSSDEFSNYIRTLYKLIKVRLYNDKKDSVDITSVIEQLHETLPEIQADEIKNISDLIKTTADSLKRQASMEKRKEHIQKLNDQYKKYEEVYNGVIYAQWYTKYHELKQKEKDLTKQLNQLENLEQKQIKLKEQNERNNSKKEALQTQVNDLKINYDNSQLMQEINKLENDLTDLLNDIENTNNQINNIETDKANVNKELYKNQDKKMKSNAEKAKGNNEIQHIIQTYALDQLTHALNPETILNAYTNNIQEYESLLNQQESLNQEQTSVKNKQKIIETNLQKVNAKLNELIIHSNNCIQTFKNTTNKIVHAANKLVPNKDLLNKEIYQTVLQTIDKYNGQQIDPFQLTEPIQEKLNQFRQDNDRKINETKDLIKNNNQEIQSNKQMIEQLEKEEVAPIPLNAYQEKSRNNLKDYIPLYEALDFKENVPESTKKIIESALYEMNLLNAIVTTDEINQTNFINDIKIKQRKTESTFFNASTTLADYILITKNTPKTLSGQIQNFLQSIYVEPQASTNFELNDEYTTIYLNGIYHTKDLVGATDPNYELKYIGEKTRKELRELKIKTLKEIIHTLKNENATLDAQIQSINITLKNIDQLKKDLEDARKSLTTYNTNVLEMNTQKSIIQTKENELAEINQKLNEINKQMEMLNYQKDKLANTSTLNFTKITKQNIPTFKKKLDILKDNYSKIEKIEIELEELEESYTQILEQLSVLDQRINEQKKVLTQKETKQKTIEEKIEVTKKQIANDKIAIDIKNFETQIESLSQTINKTIDELSDIALKLGRLNQKIENTQEVIKSQQLITNEWTELCTKALNKTVDELLNNQPIHHEKIQRSTQLQELRKRLLERVYGYNNEFIEMPLAYDDTIYSTSDTIENIYKQKLIIKTHSLHNSLEKIQLNEFYLEIKNELNKMSEIYDRNQNDGYQEFYKLVIQHKLQEYLQNANEWIKKTSDILADFETSNGAKIRLVADEKFGNIFDMSMYEIIESINTNNKKFEKRLQKQFKHAFDTAQKEYQKDPSYDVEPAIQELIDYRKWFKLTLEIKEQVNKDLNIKATWKALNKERYQHFSNGERAMISYITMIALISTQLQNTSTESSPMLKVVLFDEAFAGMDENHIDNVLSFLNKLNINYMLTNQSNNISASLKNTNVRIYQLINTNKKYNIVRSYADNTAL